MSELCKENSVRWTYENVAYGFCFVFYRNNVQTNVHADVRAYNDLTKDGKTIFIKIKENPKTLKNEEIGNTSPDTRKYGLNATRKQILLEMRHNPNITKA